jgi:hypothetical protein
MVDTTIPYQIVVFMQEYCITGGVYLREQRLSDYLNDKRETNIMLRNASIARLEDPAKILGTTPTGFIPKAGVLMVFEPPQPVQHTIPRFIKYPKEKYTVFFVMDGMEARGEIHMQQALDLHQVMAEPTLTFLPITQASVTIKANSKFMLNQVTILVNLLHIRFIGEIQAKSPTQPRQ